MQSMFHLWTAAGKPRSCVQEYWKVGKTAPRCEEMVSASCQIPLAWARPVPSMPEVSGAGLKAGHAFFPLYTCVLSKQSWTAALD